MLHSHHLACDPRNLEDLVAPRIRADFLGPKFMSGGRIQLVVNNNAQVVVAFSAAVGAEPKMNACDGFEQAEIPFPPFIVSVIGMSDRTAAPGAGCIAINRMRSVTARVSA